MLETGSEFTPRLRERSQKMPIPSEQRFARLLTEGVHRIRLRTFKTTQLVQEELGRALGRTGGSVIEYWRKGHRPPKLSDIETLAREFVSQGRVERDWLEEFLHSANHPSPTDLCDKLFSFSPRTETPTPYNRMKGNGALHSQLAPADELSPFIVGPPVTHPRSFFGRDSELNYLFSLWKRFPFQHAAVVGRRRSGKTSLLHYLRQITTTAPTHLRPGQRADWLPRASSYRWVFVDFQDARMRHPEKLLRHILLSLSLPLPPVCDLHTFMDVVSQHVRTPTIILMDELEAALTSPELDRQFWWSLCSLGSHHLHSQFAFVLTAQTTPAHLASEQPAASTFLNLFGHLLTLGPLTDAAARDLIASSPQPFAPADSEWLLTHSGRWPALLQMLCDARLRALEEGEEGEAWKEEGLRRIEAYKYLVEEDEGPLRETNEKNEK